MEIITIECPKCKGTVHVDKSVDQLFCMYCRAEIQIKPTASQDMNINHEFQARMAIAEHEEELYFRDEINFDQVMKAYDEVKQIGAHHSLYWLARARFYTKGKLHELKKDHMILSEQNEVVKQYTLLMETAMKRDDKDLRKIESEKDKTLEKIVNTFEKARQQESERLAEIEERHRKHEEEKLKRKMERIQNERLKDIARAEKTRKMLPFRIVSSIGIFIFIIFLITRCTQSQELEYEALLEQHNLVILE